MARKSSSDEELEAFTGWNEKTINDSEEKRRWHKKKIEEMTKAKTENKRDRRRRRASKKDEKKDEERSRSPSRINGTNASGDDISTESDNSTDRVEKVRQRDGGTMSLSLTQQIPQETPGLGDTATIPEVGKAGEKLQFQVKDTPPFEVHLKYTKVEERRRLLTLEVAKMLEKLAVRYVRMEEYAARTWVVFFDSRAEANRFIHLKKIDEAGYTAYIPRYIVLHKGTIRGIPLDETDEDLKKEIEQSNREIQVQEVFRLKRRTLNRKSKTKTSDQIPMETERDKAAWEPSTTVCITIRGSELPEKITLWRTIKAIERFIPATRQCFKCGKLGHIAKWCKEKDQCLKCGRDKHPEQTQCESESKCINCGGAHVTTNKRCPVLLKAAQINKCMAFQNVGFVAARRFVESFLEERAQPAKRGRMEQMDPPMRNTRNFPEMRKARESTVLGRGTWGPRGPLTTGTGSRGLEANDSELRRGPGLQGRTRSSGDGPSGMQSSSGTERGTSWTEVITRRKTHRVPSQTAHLHQQDEEITVNRERETSRDRGVVEPQESGRRKGEEYDKRLRQLLETIVVAIESSQNPLMIMEHLAACILSVNEQ